MLGVLDIQVRVRLCVPTVDVEFWCSYARCSSSTTVRPADESKNGTEKLFVRVLRSKRTRNRSAFDRMNVERGREAHTPNSSTPQDFIHYKLT